MVIVMISKRNKNKKLQAECEKRQGKWDKKTKKCEFSTNVGQSDQTVSGEGSYDPTGSTGTGIQWSPNALASEIANKIEGYNAFFYYDVADKILALTDAQLRVLYKYYNEKHATDYPTITQLFANEWDDFYFSKSPYDMVADRFRALGLY